MRKRFSVLRVYLMVVGLCGVMAVTTSVVLASRHASQFSSRMPLNSPWSLATLALFTVLALAAASFSIPIPEAEGQASSHNLGTVGVVASVVVFPGYLAILVVAVGATIMQLAIHPTGLRRAWQFTVFNIGNFVLATTAAAAVVGVLGGRRLFMSPHLPSQAPRLILAVICVVSVSYVVSYSLLVISRWLTGLVLATRSVEANPDQKRPAYPSIREIFARSHRNAILPEATAAIVGILFGYLWLINPPLAPIALLPLAVIYIAFKNFIRLQELDRLKSNFITEVSHELRTPLAAILASSELLFHHSDQMEPANVRDISRSSYESSNHLFRVVENLLNASTIQSGTLNVHPVSVSVDEMIGEAITQVQPFLESKTQAVDVELPHDLPEVLADPRYIVQVLINLLTNASKYSDPSTRIGIICAAERDDVRIDVIDQGMGISEEDQFHIFERFYRASSNTMTSVVGSGLGLTIVKSLVEMHEGRVSVTSKLGAGSSFSFTLPRAFGASVHE